MIWNLIIYFEIDVVSTYVDNVLTSIETKPEMLKKLETGKSVDKILGNPQLMTLIEKKKNRMK